MILEKDISPKLIKQINWLTENAHQNSLGFCAIYNKQLLIAPAPQLLHEMLDLIWKG